MKKVQPAIKIIRHKKTGKYVKIISSFSLIRGILVTTISHASVFNESIDGMTDEDVLQYVSCAEWKMIQMDNYKYPKLTDWDILTVKITVKIISEKT